MSNYKVIDEHESRRSLARICAIFATLMYMIIFFPVVAILMMFGVGFNIPEQSWLLEALMYTSFYLIPFSIPLSIDFIWSSYLFEKYQQTLFFCILPILTAFVMLPLESVWRAICK